MILVRPVESGADRREFVNLAYRLNAKDPNWVPPLKDEVHGLIDPRKNPWFGHAEAAFFLASRDGRTVGRISAQVDRLVQDMPEAQGGGPGTGNWGMLEAEDGETVAALLAVAEDWLRTRGMTRAIGPVSLSIWDEPGLLVLGHDHKPTVMMGHHDARHEAWIEAAGYRGIKDLHTYELDIGREFPPLVQRIVTSGERNARIRIRKVDKSRFDAEAALILGILNDAWGNNWGYVPLTDAEIAYAGKKLKPIVFEDLIRVAELDGEPVAFMMTLPDLNEMTADLNGRLFPFGFVKLLWRLRGGLSGRPKVRTMRVPLMGVVKRLQASRLASQLAFMMIEYIRRDAVAHYGASRGEIGWILDDNQGMRSIAETIDSHINRTYRIYSKPL
ncbi:N-acetyltransferase [Sphingomonas oleivorans]|uniref:N-acetyltransferase n=1 Tax=Sphingomonas oleivorans TaxID=1735121 RepID=A0A2T5FU32_9SPHN|nr:N-acetyltransferase [Sphingomonas oleivorans]PTQ07798.1 N-acetyltransferase [Sphingomonas oleivorans]